MAKRLGPFWLALSLSGCVLNPQGEDPGYEESSPAILGGTSASGAPGLFDPVAQGPNGAVAPGDAVTPGAVLDPTDPNSGVTNPANPAGPGVPGAGAPSEAPLPVAPAGTSVDVVPPVTPAPEPAQGAGGSSAGFGGSPGASGGAGPVAEPEPDAMVPGMDFDGGTFNYGKDTDGGMDDDHGDGGHIDAGVGL